MSMPADAPLLDVIAVDLFERDVTFRLPFRFGIVTLTEAPQAFARVRIRLADGREATGVSAEMLAPKWFDKNPDLSNEENFDQLRAALDIASALYRDAGPRTAFGLYAAAYHAQIDNGQARGLNPLVACFGPALLDRAILDALCLLYEVPFAAAFAANLPGIAVTALTPDLTDFDLPAYLATLKPAASAHARHTVGLVDPIADNPDPVGDGLPETLTEVIAAYGHRYFKVKVGGDLGADLERLTEIAAALDAAGPSYHVTLDGNEQYDDVDGIMALWRGMAAEPRLERFRSAIVMIEQPIKRQVALESDIGPLARERPVIIDEADGDLDAFPTARALGYAGVSSKSCKGLYKSIINAARCAAWNREGRGGPYFMSGEDLTTQAGVAVQQDLALATLLGITHVERNGHHYVDGMRGVPHEEQAAFVNVHPDLYHWAGDTARLTIRDGQVALGSLDRPGFARGADPDFAAMRTMTMPPIQRET